MGRVGGDWLLGRFQRRLGKAQRVNRETLRSILSLNASCELGRRYRFAALGSESDFRAAVPLGRWEDYAPYVDRMAQGETNVLCSEPVVYFALSSGTTGKPKLIPTTRRHQRVPMQYMSMVIPAALRRLVRGADMPYRGIILLSAPRESHVTPGGTPIGSASAGGVARAKRMVDHLWTSPWPVYGCGHPPTAWYLHALFGLKERTTLTLSGVFAPHLLAWLDFITQHWDALLDDIGRGTLSGVPDLTDTLRTQLQPFLSPAPERAAELRRAVDGRWEGFVPRAWPSVCAVMAVVSGSFSVYTPRLQHFLGDVPLYSPAYAASEAMIGINLALDPPNRYTLTAGSAHFEFIPVASIEEDQPRTCSLGELSVGEMYELVATNFAGLYRYRMRDVVRVRGFDGEAPVLEFVYRYGTLLNLVGEKTTESQTKDALARFVAEWAGSEAALVDYTTREHSTWLPPRYVFYLELRGAERLAQGDLKAAARRLDRALAEANVDYELCGRKSGRLGGPELKLVRPGTFRALEEWLLARAKGANANQVKIPRRLSDAEAVALMESRVLAAATAE